ncbi:MAG: HypC/HybG/HupF family hydrogenase formation chaperone [Anaerolineae bacterium]|nr:HypC/HybG/HupF family hydrogenase formation chaperone [Anaerolineae bacterium]NUQ02957.1 HypC/HybG/HupF family hydrogenase formation chaperone [Anaerolineae bacterium]
MCLAIPGRIVEVYDSAGLHMGRIDFDGVMKEVCLAYLPEAQIGDYILVHVGFAISKVDEEEALRTLDALREMGELAAELESDEADILQPPGSA